MLTRRLFMALPLVGTLFRSQLKQCGSKLEEWRRLLEGVESDQLEFCFEDSRGRRRFVKPYQVIKSDIGAKLDAHVEHYKRDLARVFLVDREGYMLAVKTHNVDVVDAVSYSYGVTF